jgi:hypothetical protein
VLQVAEAKFDANNQIRNSKKLTQVNFKVLFENQFLKRFYMHIWWFFQVFLSYGAMLGFNYYGVKLGAVIIGTKLFATQASRLRRCQCGQGH